MAFAREKGEDGAGGKARGWKEPGRRRELLEQVGSLHPRWSLCTLTAHMGHAPCHLFPLWDTPCLSFARLGST